ncbi:hypothetical protein OCOJLMKI_3095 [Methylobacterium iners]|uniref:Uncharacterized protein n=1 Tax=Methylobacterium iners TaxID=418707 RepID=A0ABQ4S1T3_9HYPH|nr:hypothetical protein OCOJLMKI_3095 [Methylobacterium iners]
MLRLPFTRLGCSGQLLSLLQPLLCKTQARLSAIGTQVRLIGFRFSHLGPPFSPFRLLNGALDEGMRLLHDRLGSVPLTTDLRANIADQLERTRPVRIL